MLSFTKILDENVIGVLHKRQIRDKIKCRSRTDHLAPQHQHCNTSQYGTTLYVKNRKKTIELKAGEYFSIASSM